MDGIENSNPNGNPSQTVSTEMKKPPTMSKERALFSVTDLSRRFQQRKTAKYFDSAEYEMKRQIKPKIDKDCKEHVKE